MHRLLFIIHVCGYLPMGTNMHMIYNIKCFTGLFNVSRETFDTTAFDTTLIFNESHECPVAADMQCALVCSLAHFCTSYILTQPYFCVNTKILAAMVSRSQTCMMKTTCGYSIF